MTPIALCLCTITVMLAPTRPAAGEARDRISDTLPLSPSLTERLSEEAYEALERGALRHAVTLFRMVLREVPDRVGDTAGLAEALIQWEKFNEAVELLAESRARFPRNARIHFLLAQAQYRLGNKRIAHRSFRRAYCLDPSLPDVRYYLATYHIDCEEPIAALHRLWGAPVSGQEIDWSRDLAIGNAYDQLGLRAEAACYYANVAEDASESEFAYLSDLGRKYHENMDRTLLERERLRGAVTATYRYDNRPSILPTFNSVGVPLPSGPSHGNQFRGDFGYDLCRGYNSDVTLGYTFFHTQNYSEHDFDQLDNVVSLDWQRRTLWRCQPVFAGARVDYDYLTVGTRSFLQRAGVAPYVTLLHDDYRSTTVHGRYGLYDFKGQGVFNETDFDLDSVNYMLGLTKRRRFPCWDMAVWGGYQFKWNESDGSLNSFASHTAIGGLVRNLPFANARFELSGEVSFRNYDNVNTPLGFAREDVEYTVVGKVLMPLRQDGLFLTTSIVYDSNNSNNRLPPFFDNQYEHFVFDFGLEYRFPQSWADRSRVIR